MAAVVLTLAVGAVFGFVLGCEVGFAYANWKNRNRPLDKDDNRC